MSKCFAIAGAIALAAGAASAAITQYSQDFEAYGFASPTVIGDDGWLVGANVFDSGGGFIYNYFAFPAPNSNDGNGSRFSAVAAGEGGAAQGAQQLNTFNDYNNGDHAANPTRIIEANIFREYVIDASNVGETWSFTFDYKTGNALPGSALAFIKVLNPNAGFSLSHFLTEDTSQSPLWSTGTLSLTIDASLQGQIFQIGFLNTASGFSPSGVFYDNINLVPAPGAAGMIALGGLLAARRRR